MTLTDLWNRITGKAEFDALMRGWANGWEQAREAAAEVCVEWGKGKVAKWDHNAEMLEDAKARAWDALQCAAEIRERLK